MNYMHYCTNCKQPFLNEETHANCPICHTPGIYLHMNVNEWNEASALQKDKIIKDAIDANIVSPDIQSEMHDELKSMHNEMNSMHKKVTFMFGVTVVLLVCWLISAIITFNYAKKLNNIFQALGENIEDTLDDYNSDYHSLFD